MTSMKHHCHAIGCTAICKPEFLMCPKHWRMVPKREQFAVYRAYRHGQCDDKQISRSWLVAADTAISCVAVMEGKMTPEQAKNMIEHAKTFNPSWDKA